MGKVEGAPQPLVELLSQVHQVVSGLVPITAVAQQPLGGPVPPGSEDVDMSEEALLQLIEVDCAADPLFNAMDQSKRKEFAKTLAS
eukprot:10506111-Heterocapsa_arctica.AAC.1